ncbi:ABA4-like family protein [Gangjinia marincola]|uniref:ABA4-like family protein n=1 Tax=Gangjinia marincola TaxID=578463 RepID=A0ABN1MFT7_9FLAO
MEEIFTTVNIVALSSWLLLAIFPYRKWSKKVLLSLVIFGLSILYTTLMISYFDPGTMDQFSTVKGLVALFGNQDTVVIGWIHYLAFDLLAGIYITSQAEKIKLNRILLTLCLVFTFMMGPLGFLLFLIIRSIKTKRLLHDF